MNIGDKIPDCYLGGYGNLVESGDEGQIEFIGRDYVIIRNLSNDKPIFVEMTVSELAELIRTW